MTYEEQLAEELREWHDMSLDFDPHDPEIREAMAGWSAVFDDEREANDAEG